MAPQTNHRKKSLLKALFSFFFFSTVVLSYSQYLDQDKPLRITASHYALFLNKIAQSDPENLYDAKMSTDLATGCLCREGVPGSYFYYAIAGREEFLVPFIKEDGKNLFYQEQHLSSCDVRSECDLELRSNQSFFHEEVGEALKQMRSSSKEGFFSMLLKGVFLGAAIVASESSHEVPPLERASSLEIAERSLEEEHQGGYPSFASEEESLLPEESLHHPFLGENNSFPLRVKPSAKEDAPKTFLEKVRRFFPTSRKIAIGRETIISPLYENNERIESEKKASSHSPKEDTGIENFEKFKNLCLGFAEANKIDSEQLESMEQLALAIFQNAQSKKDIAIFSLNQSRYQDYATAWKQAKKVGYDMTRLPLLNPEIVLDEVQARKNEAWDKYVSLAQAKSAMGKLLLLWDDFNQKADAFHAKSSKEEEKVLIRAASKVNFESQHIYKKLISLNEGRIAFKASKFKDASEAFYEFLIKEKHYSEDYDYVRGPAFAIKSSPYSVQQPSLEWKEENRWFIEAAQKIVNITDAYIRSKKIKISSDSMRDFDSQF